MLEEVISSDPTELLEAPKLRRKLPDAAESGGSRTAVQGYRP